MANQDQFFKPGNETTPGLTTVAKMGYFQPLYDTVLVKTGVVTGLSPVLVAVYTGNRNPIFGINENDSGLGLKEIAQVGDASRLKAALERQPEVKQVHVLGDKDFGPGTKVEKTISVNGADKIAFATMFGSSNDWFYANNRPIDANTTGDITSSVSLYDDGTAVSQYPGAGNAQPGFANRPITENLPIREVKDTAFPVPAVNEVLKVTIG